MTKEEALAIQSQVQEETARRVPYEGYKSQTALLSLDTALDVIAKNAADDGETPYVIRDAYREVHKALQQVRTKLVHVDNLNAQRLVPCYTIEGGKLVRMKLDVLLQKLQEVEGHIF